MKTTTIAAAAVLLGSVAAEWESWSGSSADSDSKTPVLDKTTFSKTTDPAKTTEASKTFHSKPATETTTSYSKPSDTGKSHSKPATGTSTEEDDSAASTWSAWSSASTPADTTSKSKTSTDPAASSSGWGEWEAASSFPAVKTSTDPASTWSEWESTSTPSVETSTDPHTWSEWESSTPSVETSTDPAHTWSEWESSSTPAVVTSTDPAHTWSAWDPTSTVTSTSTQWITVTVYPVDGGKDQTWSEWTSDPATSTKYDTNTVIVSSTITKTASNAKDSSAAESWSAWSSIATPVAAVDPGCKLEVSISYGAPVWYPTPVIAAEANTTTWGEWESTSTDPAAETGLSTWTVWVAPSSSTPAVETSTWSEWESTSTDPAVETSTWSEWESTSTDPAAETTTVWSEWESTTTDPAVETTTWSEWESSSTDPAASSSWTAWESSASESASQTKGGAFYTAPAGGDSSSSSGSNSGSWSKGSTGISANGNKFGMTYSPYTAGGNCKDQATVSADVAKLAAKGFTSIRVYSTDCSTLEFVGGAAREHGIKVILGVFISETGVSGAQPQVDAIAKWAQWDLVELIVVGNEAVFNGRCSASDLASFIGSAKKTFQGAGFKGAISTTDELSVWQSQGKAWCDVVDVVSANLYAFFNPNTAAEDAGDFIQRQIQDLSAVCPGKEVYVMESGWPSAGECNGKACPSPENQATAIKGIQQSSGAKVVFFSFEDEQWKKPGQFGVEQHWGCGEVFN